MPDYSAGMPWQIRVVTPDEPPTLTPGAAFALLRLLRSAANRRVDGEGSADVVEFRRTDDTQEQRRAA